MNKKQNAICLNSLKELRCVKKIHKKMQLVPLKKWQKRRLSKHKFRRFCTTHSNSPFVTHNIKKCYVVMNLSNLKLAVYHIFSLKLKPFDFLEASYHKLPYNLLTIDSFNFQCKAPNTSLRLTFSI